MAKNNSRHKGIRGSYAQIRTTPCCNFPVPLRGQYGVSQGICIHERDVMAVTAFTCVGEEQHRFQQDMRANAATARTPHRIVGDICRQREGGSLHSRFTGYATALIDARNIRACRLF